MIKLSEILTWIHLSDLHTVKSDLCDVKKEIEIEQEISFKILYNEINDIIMNNNINLDYLIITGDLASKGSEDDYLIVEKLLKQLKELTHVREILIVPGNHDINRKVITENGKCFREYFDNNKKVKNFLDSSNEEKELVLRTMSNYFNFFNKLFSHLSILNFNRFSYTLNINKLNKKISFLGLNSTWLSLDDEDKEKLIIGKKQVARVLNESFDSEIKIILMHHPLEWIKYFEREVVEELLYNNCNIILHGHLHDDEVSYYKMVNNTHIFRSGTCNLIDENKYSYNIVSLNIKTNRGTCIIREFDKIKNEWKYYKDKKKFEFDIMIKELFVPYITEDDLFENSEKYLYNTFLKGKINIDGQDIIASDYYISILSIFKNILTIFNRDVKISKKIIGIKNIIYNAIDKKIFHPLIIHAQNVSKQVINEYEHEIIILCFIIYIINNYW